MAMQKFNPTQSNPWGLMAQDGSRVCASLRPCAGGGEGRNEKGLGLPRWTPRLPFTCPHDPKGPQLPDRLPRWIRGPLPREWSISAARGPLWALLVSPGASGQRNRRCGAGAEAAWLVAG